MFYFHFILNMKSTSFLQKHKRIGFKRPVLTVCVVDVPDQETEEEKEITESDSNSISSPEEIQPSSPILKALPDKEKNKLINFDFPLNIENEKTIPEPPSDLFECSFNWITEDKFDFQQDSECDDLFFTHFDFSNMF